MTSPIIDLKAVLGQKGKAGSDSIIDLKRVSYGPEHAVEPYADFFTRYDEATKAERYAVYGALGFEDAPTIKGMLDTIPNGILNIASFLTNPKLGGRGFGAAAHGLYEQGAALIPNPFNSNSFADELKTSAKALVDLPVGIAVGLASPIIALTEVVIGADLAMKGDSGEDFFDQFSIIQKAALTDEDREERGRTIAANIIAFAVGGAATKAVGRTLGAQSKALGGSIFKELGKAKNFEAVRGIIAGSDIEIGRLIETIKAPRGTTLMRNQAAHTAAAGSFGATLGILEHDDPAEAVEAAFSLAAIALPFGMASASIGKRFAGAKYADKADWISQAALDVAKLRTVNMLTTHTPLEMLSNIENIHVTKNLQATAAAAAIRYEKVGMDHQGNPVEYGVGARIIPEVRVEDASSVLDIITSKSKADGIKRRSTLHKRADGTLDVLVSPDDISAEVAADFERTGYITGQQVSYGGERNWILESVDSKGQVANIRHMTATERTTSSYDPTLKGEQTVRKQVPMSDLMRPTNKHLTELAYDQTRKLAMEDIFDLSQSFVESSSTPNAMGASFFGHHGGAGIQGKIDFIEYGLKTVNGDWTLDQTTAGKFLITKPTASGNGRQLIQELQPGLNEIVAQHSDGRKYVTVVYVGGKLQKVMENGVEKTVQIGKENDIVFAMDYYEVENPFSRQRRNFVENTAADIDVDAQGQPVQPNRHLAMQELMEYRAKKNLFQTNSSLSPGSSKFYVKLSQRYPDLIPKIRKTFGVVDEKTVGNVLFQDFLDFTRFGEDRLTRRINQRAPERVGTPIGQGIPAPLGTTAADLAQRRSSGLGTSTITYNPVKESDQVYFNREGRARADEVTATRQLETANRLEHTPVPEPQFGESLAPTDKPNASFNELFNDWIQQRGLDPKVAPLVRAHLEQRLGEMLLGEKSAMQEFSSFTSVPWLTRAIERTANDINKFEADWPDMVALRNHWNQGGNVKFGNKKFAPHQTDIADLLATVGQAKNNLKIFETRKALIEAQERPALSILERELAERLQKDIIDTRSVMANHVFHVASETGHYVTREKGGRINIYDAETHTLQQKFNTMEDAIEYMKKTGQVEGMNIDGGAGNNIVPPESLGSHLMGGPPALEEPHKVPFNFKPRGRLEKIVDALNSIPWASTKRAFSVAIDNQFGSRLFSDVYAPMQTASLRRDIAANKYLLRVQEIEKRLEKLGIPREEWELITDYSESLSPADIKKRLFNHRPLTQTEVSYSDQIMKLGVDVDKISDYRRTRIELMADIKKRGAKINTQTPAGVQEMEALQLELSEKLELIRNKLVMTSADMEAHAIFEKILAEDPDTARLDAVTKLVRAQSGGAQAFSRQEFLASKKMHPKLIEAAHEIDAIKAELAQEFDVNESVSYYLDHFKHEKESPTAINATGPKSPLAASETKTKEFANRLVQTGENNGMHSRDPIASLVSYIRAGMNDIHFEKTWETAFKRSHEEVANLPPEMRGKVAKVMGEYLFDMKGYKAESDVYMQSVINHYLDAAKIDKDVNLRKDIIHTMLAANSGSFIGFRPAQGARDVNTGFKILVTRFGLDFYKKGFELAFKRGADGKLPMERLAQEGTIPTLSPIMFQTAEELANEMIGKRGQRPIEKGINKFADVGFQATGQPNIYALHHAIAYLAMKDRAGPEILKLMRDQTTKAEAYKNIGLNTFYKPIAMEFDRLIMEGKGDLAVDFLSKQAGVETAFVFGLHNQPYLWGTSVGRLMGHYGQWPVWNRQFLTQVASRGTGAERAAAMKRYAITEAMTFATGKAFGMNMRSWMLVPGAVFMGGPSMDAAFQMYDMTGARGERRKDLALAMHGPRIPVISNFIPGSGAFNDYYAAFQMQQKGFNPASVLLKGLGFSLDRRQASLLDEVLDYRPKVK
ncbi:MAG: hypothetical protein H0U60_19510, partial [Blastocatellia bacterium]|nr:hypothetical protein [Blastocatellia bacterium]